MEKIKRRETMFIGMLCGTQIAEVFFYKGLYIYYEKPGRKDVRMVINGAKC